MTFMEAIDYAKQTSIDAIEPYPTAELAAPDVDAAKRIRDYAMEQGIAISCFSMGVDLAGDGRREGVEIVKKYARVAAALGSPLLHHTIYPYLDFGHGSLPFARAMKRAVESVREIYDCAAELGVMDVCENQGLYFNGVQRFDDFLGELNRDMGVVLDVGNIFFVGETPEAFAARFASRICHVHVKDYLRKDASWPYPGEGWYTARDGAFLRDTVIGHGAVRYPRIFSILRDVGYSGYFSLEYSAPEPVEMAIPQSLAYLARCEKMAVLEK